VQSGTRAPDGLGPWRGQPHPWVRRPSPASSPFPWSTRSAARDAGDWAVSLRAAQLLAGVSFMRRRSVAPLGASLAFSEIASSACAPADGVCSNNRAIHRPHARPRKDSCVPTHLCHHTSPREQRASPPRLPRNPTVHPGRACCVITSTRLAREPMAGRSGPPLCRNRMVLLAGRPRPKGLVSALGEGPRRPASSISVVTPWLPPEMRTRKAGLPCPPENPVRAFARRALRFRASLWASPDLRTACPPT